jgi:exonuclease SbcD
VGRALRSLEGSLEELLLDPQLEAARACWVRAVLTDDHLPRQAMARLRQRFPHAVELRHRPQRQEAMVTSQRTRQIRAARSPLDRILAFYTDQQGREPSKDEIELLRQRSRPYLFSNTLAPAIAGASLVAVTGDPQAGAPVVKRTAVRK